MRAAAILAGTLAIACSHAPPPPPASAAVIAPEEEREPCTCRWWHMPVVIYFGPGSALIEPDFRQNGEVIEELATTIARRRDVVAVRVEGHNGYCALERADPGLSEARAVAVRAELVRLGLPPERVTTIGYGSSMPRKGAQKENPDPCTAEQHARGEVAHSHRVEISIHRCIDRSEAPCRAERTAEDR